MLGENAVRRRAAPISSAMEWKRLLKISSSTGSRMRVSLSRPWDSHQEVRRHKEKKNHGNHTIHREKCRVQFAEIIRRDQRVFISQKSRYHYYSSDGQLPESKHHD